MVVYPFRILWEILRNLSFQANDGVTHSCTQVRPNSPQRGIWLRCFWGSIHRHMSRQVPVLILSLLQALLRWNLTLRWGIVCLCSTFEQSFKTWVSFSQHVCLQWCCFGINHRRTCTSSTRPKHFSTFTTQIYSCLSFDPLRTCCTCNIHQFFSYVPPKIQDKANRIDDCILHMSCDYNLGFSQLVFHI